MFYESVSVAFKVFSKIKNIKYCKSENFFKEIFYIMLPEEEDRINFHISKVR